MPDKLSAELDAIVPIVCHSSLFQGLSEDEVRTIMPCIESRMHAFSEGEYVWRSGDAVTKIGLVVSGTVHIIEEDFWGNRNIIAQIGVGDEFGEAYACVPDCHMRSSVVAVDGAQVLFMEFGKMATSCGNSCAFHQRLVRNLLTELARKNLLLAEKLEHASQRTTRDKLLSYLSAESNRQGRLAFDIPFDRQQLADYLSVDRSAMSSELGKLRDEGLIMFRKNRFELNATAF